MRCLGQDSDVLLHARGCTKVPKGEGGKAQDFDKNGARSVTTVEQSWQVWKPAWDSVQDFAPLDQFQNYARVSKCRTEVARGVTGVFCWQQRASKATGCVREDFEILGLGQARKEVLSRHTAALGGDQKVSVLGDLRSARFLRQGEKMESASRQWDLDWNALSISLRRTFSLRFSITCQVLNIDARLTVLVGSQNKIVLQCI